MGKLIKASTTLTTWIVHSLVVLGQVLFIEVSVDLATLLTEWLWIEKCRGVWDKIDAVMDLADCALHEIAPLYPKMGGSIKGLCNTQPCSQVMP